MDHLKHSANAVLGVLIHVIERLFGCSHCRTTLPRTSPASLAIEGQPAVQPRTYVVCLDCGRQFPYDWAAMRGTAHIGSAHRKPALRRVWWNHIRDTALAFALLLLVTAFPAGDARAQTPEPYVLKVNVDLVVLHATVRDRKGRLVSDLREQDFAVFEDGVRQSTRLFRNEDIPVTVGLIVDHSGSMRSKMADVITAARTFVAFSSEQDQMFVVNFNEHVSFGLPNGLDLTNKPNELAKAIANTPVTGKTALYDAIWEARTRMRASTHEKKVLIIISDGGDNASKHSLEEVVRMGGQSSALVYAIGISDPDDPDRNPAVLRRLAESTGGEAYFLKNSEEVAPICGRIARDIRHQYTIGYVSNNAAPATTYRNIRVGARTEANKDLFVRTRTGYQAGGGTPAVKPEGAR